MTQPIMEIALDMEKLKAKIADALTSKPDAVVGLKNTLQLALDKLDSASEELNSVKGSADDVKEYADEVGNDLTAVENCLKGMIKSLSA